MIIGDPYGDWDEVCLSISDVTIPASEFYAILSKWHSAFQSEWAEAIAMRDRQSTPEPEIQPSSSSRGLN